MIYTQIYSVDSYVTKRNFVDKQNIDILPPLFVCGENIIMLHVIFQASQNSAFACTCLNCLSPPQEDFLY